MAVNASGDLLQAGIGGTAWLTTPGGSTNGAVFGPLAACSLASGAVDPAGNGYVLSQNASPNAPVISKLSPSGAVSVYAGGGTVCATATDAWGDGCPATNAVLSAVPCSRDAMVVDSHGNLYFADNSRQTVRRVDHQTGVITLVAGTTSGSGFGDGGPATQAMLGNINGLAVDDVGNVFLSQVTRNVVRKVDAATGIINTLAIPGLGTPGALAVDSHGMLYVADANTTTIIGVSGVSNVSNATTNCLAQAPVDGVCGAADGMTLTAAPTLATDLCSAGTPYPVAGSGPWNWSCAGLNGGAVAACSAQAAATGPATPNGLSAAAVSTTEVDLQWNPVAGAASYQIDRMAAGGGFTQIATSTDPQYPDTGVAPHGAYLYRVRAVSGSSTSPNSAADLATTVVFTNDPLTSGTTVKAVHLAELRTAVDAVRNLAGLPPGSYTDAAVKGTTIKAVHLTELRSALDAARAALGLSANTYTDATLSGVRVKAVHVQELRAGVR